LLTVPPEESHLGVDSEGVFGEVFFTALRAEKEVREFVEDEAEVG
jgi:hypothetical protein